MQKFPVIIIPFASMIVLQRQKNSIAASVTVLLITDLLTEIGEQMGWLASGMNLRFLRPVYFEDTVRCDFTITAVDERGRAEAKVVFLNGDGQTVSEAVLTGILPGEDEKRIMHDMLAEGDPTNRAASSIPAAPQRTEKA